jgi:hypothetical protein
MMNRRISLAALAILAAAVVGSNAATGRIIAVAEFSRTADRPQMIGCGSHVCPARALGDDFAAIILPT